MIFYPKGMYVYEPVWIIPIQKGAQDDPQTSVDSAELRGEYDLEPHP